MIVLTKLCYVFFFFSFVVSAVSVCCMGGMGERVLVFPGLSITTTQGRNLSLQLAIDAFRIL